MATAILDPQDGVIEATEHKGRIQTLRREAQITGITATGAVGVINEMLGATGLPAKGSAIVVGSDVLRLVSREPRRGDDIGSGRVTLVYERAEGSSEEGTGSVPTLRGGSSLKQVETVYDGNGDQIVLSHTWPATHKGVYPDGTPKADTTETQGGTIRVLVPMSRLSGAFQKATASPGALTESYIGHVNSSTWQGGAARTWMCTQADFELVDDTVSPPLYEFRFTFERDPETWDNDTTARFVDPDTGEPPDGLALGEGIKKVEFYPEKNFGDDF